MLEFITTNSVNIFYASAIATATTFITGILFFVVGGLMGPVNDVAAIVQVVLMAAVAVLLHQVLATVAPAVSLAALVILLLSALVATIAQGALVLRIINFEQSMQIGLPAGVGFAVWLILLAFLFWRAETFGMLLVILAVLSGLSYIAIAIGYWRGGQSHPAFLSGSAIALLAYTGLAYVLAKNFAPR